MGNSAPAGFTCFCDGVLPDSIELYTGKVGAVACVPISLGGHGHWFSDCALQTCWPARLCVAFFNWARRMDYLARQSGNKAAVTLAMCAHLPSGSNAGVAAHRQKLDVVAKHWLNARCLLHRVFRPAATTRIALARVRCHRTGWCHDFGFAAQRKRKGAVGCRVDLAGGTHCVWR